MRSDASSVVFRRTTRSNNRTSCIVARIFEQGVADTNHLKDLYGTVQLLLEATRLAAVDERDAKNLASDIDCRWRVRPFPAEACASKIIIHPVVSFACDLPVLIFSNKHKCSSER